jgi:hypothetical protein
VENVVAESLHSSMQGTSVNVFRRFSQLWHLSRDLTTTRRSLGRAMWEFELYLLVKTIDQSYISLILFIVSHCFQ